MKRKLILYFFYMGLVSAVIGILCTVLVYHEIIKEEVLENLRDKADMIVASCQKTGDYSDLSVFNSENLRLTLIDNNGKVIYESDSDAYKMGNHIDRREIQDAVTKGSGSDIRVSQTIGIQDYYYARKLENGNILRLSTQADYVFSLIESFLYLFIITISLIVIGSIVISIKLTGNILIPVKRMYEAIEKEPVSVSEENGNFYPELLPMIEEIRRQRKTQENMRKEFTANVSHELKTPLTAISGYAEMIETGIASDSDIKKFAGKIHSESSRMFALVNDIIKLSKLDNDFPEETNDVVNLYELSKECKENLELEAKKKGTSVTVTGNATPFKGNRQEIYELIYNLLDNAIKYNRQNGNVDIILSEKSIRISDTGIGISTEDKQHIFERFYRADKSRSRHNGGTGLGLAIVKHIVEKNNAEISVESRVGIGTDIVVNFA